MTAARLQLAGEALAAGEVDTAIVELSAAVREAEDPRAGALAAARLGQLFNTVLGNKVAARPWLARADRLVADLPPCIEQGWVALAPLGCEVEDPEVLVERAALALDRARTFGDAALEVKALADGGLGHVQAGRVAVGMAMIDEAMALACGGASEDLDTVRSSVCSFYTACWFTADFVRAESWTQLLRQRGYVGAHDSPSAAFVSSHCDSVQATLLRHLGRWGEAEDLLVHARAAIDAVVPGAAWHPVIALAELRILQGRLAEAEELLLGRDHHLEALLPMARLHLARGDLDLARAAAQRGLGIMGGDRIRASALLAVLAEVQLRLGDVGAAAATVAQLADVDVPALVAEAARLRARVRAAEGDHDAAVAALHQGLGALAGTQLPLLRLLLHVELARVLEPVDRAAAVVEARAAASLLSELDIVLDAADGALLGRLAADEGAPCQIATLRRDGAWWVAGCGDVHVRLRDTKGLRYLAELLAHPGVERTAWDLVDVVEGVGDVDRRRLGDAGELLDATARDAYRRRVSGLQEEIEAALAVEEDDRAAVLQVELDALLDELARGLGLSGQHRRASSAAEKARLNVTRAIRAAIAKVTEALPEAGPALDRRVRTGHACAYEPQALDEVTWVFNGR